jgi:hypothetical protein
MRWSQLKTRLIERCAPGLRKHVAVHQARYRYTREEVGRVWLTIDGREVVSFDASTYNDFGALVDLEAYLSLTIDAALTSPSPLVRALAVIDRRVGKRKLRSLKMDSEHPLVRELYLLRCKAEGVDVDRPA